MQQYLTLLHKLLTAPVKPSRNDETSHSLFAYNLEFNMQEGFPLVTTKFVSYKNVLSELLWFISGSTDIQDLWSKNCHIWDANYHNEQWQRKIRKYSLPQFSVGYIYGSQWVDFNGSGINQLTNLVHGLRTDPFSRRHVVTAWNPEDLHLMCLPPCHCMFMCDVQEWNGTKLLNMHVTMRSCDVFLGLPYNIASYATLLCMLACCTGMNANTLSMTLVNAHLYSNAIDAAKLQLTREPLPLPSLYLDTRATELCMFTPEDVELCNYNAHKAIKVEMVE